MMGAMVKAAAGRILPLIFLLLALRLAASSSADLVILKAERLIDLTSPIVRSSVSLKVQNSDALPSSEVLIAFPSTQIKRLALLNVVAVEGKRKKKSFKPLIVNPTKLPDIPEHVHLFSVSLPNSLNVGETISLEVIFILTHSLEPFPKEIMQSESQFVYYDDSAVLLSPYLVKEQITHIKTPNNKIESYTKINPVNVVGSELKYGTYSDRLPFSSDLIRVHFENNHPFAVIEEFTREVEISHWGSIQVTEHYSLAHAGARHKGVFSRLDYQSKPSFSGISSFKHLLARLPPRVHSVYYRDEIGNISSSHLRGDRLKVFIILSCLIAVSVNFSTFLVIGKTSPVTYQVLGHLKTCLILTFGYTLLHDPFTYRNVLGILIAIIGMGLYSYFCTRESKKRQNDDDHLLIPNSQTKNRETTPLLIAINSDNSDIGAENKKSGR